MKKTKVKNKLSKKQKIIIGVTSVLVVVGGGIGYIQISQLKEKQRIEANIHELYKITGREKIFINGKIKPIKSEKLSINPQQGELSQIKVEDKTYVEKGTPLFTCKNSSQIKEIESLKEQISSKNKEKSNAHDEETKIIIEEEIKLLNKQINELNKIAYSTVYAPFSGKAYLNKNDEDTSHVLVLETVDLYVQGEVNERDSYKINIGQGVEIKALANSEIYTGKITEIGDRPFEGENFGQSHGADSGMTKYEVNMSLENQDNLKNGLNVQIVALNKNTSIKLPNVSVIEEDGKYYVFKVEDKKAVKKEVNVVERKDEYYLIEGGLKESDEIIKDVLTVPIKNGDDVYTGFDL